MTTATTKMLTADFDGAVNRAAFLLLGAMRENATPADQELWADAAMRAVQECANRDGQLSVLTAADIAMCAIAGRARDLFTETVNQRDRLPQEMRAFLIAEFAKLLDAETERVCAFD